MTAYRQEHGDRNVSLQKQPNSMAAAKPPAPTYESPLIAGAKPVAQFRFRILVVDDEPLIRETAKMILEGEGYEVLTAKTGWMA